MDTCKCGKPGLSTLKHIGVICSRCLTAQIEKRYRKNTRMRYGFTPGMTVFVPSDGSKEAFLNEWFLSNIAKKMPLKVHCGKKALRGEIKVSNLNASSYASLGLKMVVHGKKIPGKDIAPLSCATEEELLIVAATLGYKGTKLNIVDPFIIECEKRYPGITLAAANCTDILRRIK